MKTSLFSRLADLGLNFIMAVNTGSNIPYYKLIDQYDGINLHEDHLGVITIVRWLTDTDSVSKTTYNLTLADIQAIADYIPANEEIGF